MGYLNSWKSSNRKDGPPNFYQAAAQRIKEGLARAVKTKKNTPKVDKQERKKKKTGRAKRR